MKILKLQYILILAVLPACQDENFQVPMEENEVHIATENEILLKRGYSDYTLTAERLAGLEGCPAHRPPPLPRTTRPRAPRRPMTS